MRADKMTLRYITDIAGNYYEQRKVAERIFTTPVNTSSVACRRQLLLEEKPGKNS
jgi:hypothetical protein